MGNKEEAGNTPIENTKPVTFGMKQILNFYIL